jgi:hypothetical protein
VAADRAALPGVCREPEGEPKASTNVADEPADSARLTSNLVLPRAAGYDSAQNPAKRDHLDLDGHRLPVMPGPG